MKFYIVKIRNTDVKVKAKSYIEARKKARAGKGRVVGIYFR